MVPIAADHDLSLGKGHPRRGPKPINAVFPDPDNIKPLGQVPSPSRPSVRAFTAAAAMADPPREPRTVA